MRAPRGLLFLMLILLLYLSLSPVAGTSAQVSDSQTGLRLIGAVTDRLKQPVLEAQVLLKKGESVVAEGLTQADGSYTLVLPDAARGDFTLLVKRQHFMDATLSITAEDIAGLSPDEALVIPTIEMERQVTLAFWVATLVFAGMLLMIALEKLHNVLAALTGVSLVLGVSYLGEPLVRDLYIFDFLRALQYIDWNVIFLIMGMMIVIAVVEGTGLFHWLAFFAYRISRGKASLLMGILMVITALASAFLDNVTTMLLMTPITVQIALALGLNPLTLLIPEVMASNVGGIITLVGTPTNILIGSFANISFAGFLTNLTPGVLISLVGLFAYCLIVYRKDLATSSAGISPALLEKLEENAQIMEPGNLRRVGWVGLGMLVLFLVGERFHLLPAVTAMLGATALLVWIRPNVEEMIEAVDWTTLVFFMALFIVVGAIQEVGLVSMLAQWIAGVIGGNLPLAMITVIWAGALISTVIANIPFTAAMLPVIGYLTTTIPGAESLVLFFCLSVGSAMGGNGSLIGASANMVTAGIAERVGYPISYAYFLRKGMPALFLTVALATGWLLVRFVV
ncbi:MAG: citrate transporter [Anaerolineales bacterium]|nr:citrate transporter [Anaerolineales bacterium]